MRSTTYGTVEPVRKHQLSVFILDKDITASGQDVPDPIPITLEIRYVSAGAIKAFIGNFTHSVFPQ
jgi:hypothetical protein